MQSNENGIKAVVSEDVATAFNGDLYEAARKNLPGKIIRQFNGPQEPDFEENFYILKHTKCPAVLTENFFMDNVDDVRFLESREGKNALTLLHIEGIKYYMCLHY